MQGHQVRAGSGSGYYKRSTSKTAGVKRSRKCKMWMIIADTADETIAGDIRTSNIYGGVRAILDGLEKFVKPRRGRSSTPLSDRTVRYLCPSIKV